jgi:hypothetical protein
MLANANQASMDLIVRKQPKTYSTNITQIHVSVCHVSIMENVIRIWVSQIQNLNVNVSPDFTVLIARPIYEVVHHFHALKIANALKCLKT